MKKFTFLSLIMISMISFLPMKSIGQDLIITGVVDGSMPNGTPKAVELYVINDIVDLSIYGIGSATNGGGTDGEEFTFPAVAATAGDFIYIGNTTPENFNTFFDFDPDHLTSAVNINGDDALELFHNGSVIDLFGDINTIGDGEYWDYTDGWAYRVNGTVSDGTFTETSWNMSGINVLDEETSNATATTPFPIGTYSSTALPSSITVTYPATPGESFEVGTTITMTWDYESVTGLANIAVDLGDGEGYFDIYTDVEITLGTYDIEIPTEAGAHPIVTAKIYMIDTPTLFGESAVFSITDNTVPAILTLTPENMEINVAVDANLEIEFDELILPVTGNIVIKQLSDDAVFETIDITTTTVDFNILSIPVSGTFENETTYYVEIDATAITDPYGNTFPGITGNSTWQFTTEALPAPGESCDNAIIATEGINVADNANGGQWFEFTVPQDGHLTVSTCTTTLLDTYLEIYSNCVGTWIDGNDDNCGDAQEEVTIDVLSGETFYIYWGDDYMSGSYDWLLTFETINSETDFIEYSFPQQTTAANINLTNHTIDIEVGFSTDVTNLTANFTLSNYASADILGTPQGSGSTSNNFTTPVTYTVTAEDATTQDWIVTVTVADIYTEKDILTYSFPEQTGEATIDNINFNVNIEVNWMADITNLIADFTLSYGASAEANTVAQTSGSTANDFTLPVIYTVIAENTSTQDWTVTVTQQTIPIGATCDDTIAYAMINDAPVNGTIFSNEPRWYSVELDRNYNNVLISTCGSMFDTRIELWENCTDLDYLAENDDADNPCPLNDVASKIEIGPLNAGIYLVKVFGYDEYEYGDYQLEITGTYTDLDVIFPLEINYSCDFTGQDTVPMFLQNVGTELIPASDTVFTYYQIEGEAIIADTLVLDNDVNPSDTIFYFFDETADFSTIGVYSFSMWFNYTNDLINENDTLNGFVEFFGELIVDLGGVNDTLVVSSYPTTLDAGMGINDWMYLWQDGSTNQTLEVNTDGWYTVQIEDTVGCWAIDSVYVTLVENIDFATTNTSINVYPNPNKGQFTLEVATALNSNIDIQLINIQGQIIETISQENISEYRKQFDVSEYAKGIYYIKVNTGEQIEIKKVVIQ